MTTTIMDGSSLDISEQRKQELKQLFPSVFTETINDAGEIVETLDFERLKAELGNFSEVYDNRRERYGMDWPGKRECLRLIQEPSHATLKPCRDESVDFDSTENLFIEGDNLEVLKLLQKSYYGQVKMIYIDPPYNTGKEFIYPDNFSENLDTYLEYAGLKEIGGEERKWSSNSPNEGRFHTKWLNMMYPRLYLARNLLSEDGAIFISIDDNEVVNLRRLCDEIFGEENFVCSFAWQKRYAPPPDTRGVGYQHESIVMYRRSDKFTSKLLPLSSEQVARYKNPDNDPRGPWKAADYTCRYTSDERPSLYYPIINPNTNEEIWPKKTRVWGSSKEVTETNLREQRIWWGHDGTNSTPALKNYLSDIKQGRTPSTLLLHSEVGHTDEAAKELRVLIPEVTFTSKPTRLISHLMSICTDHDDIVLDFFAGSGSTAQAVFQRSVEVARRFILVQLPEPCSEKSGEYKAGYKTIADIAKERIRRAGQKIRAELEDQPDSDKRPQPDLGFKVLKLNQSNFKQWQAPSKDVSDEALLNQMELLVENVEPDVSQESLLYEILIKSGIMPTEKVEAIELVGQSLFSVAEGALLIHLDETIDQPLIDAVLEQTPSQFICLDSAFHGNDQLKANTVQTFTAYNQKRDRIDQIEFKTV
ncbi:site-specific DNA-methyltransferase [Vibrio alginolyticus]|nr:site-specific DNA-methyltransferase [Vibrio alginolyticus]